MSDKEIVCALIDRNRFMTRQFFYVNCRPLFAGIINHVFDYPVDYDEFVNELYRLLMENDARRLRQFDFRSSIYQWIKTVAIRHFSYKRDEMIDNQTKSPLFNRRDEKEGDDNMEVVTCEESVDTESAIAARMDLEYLFSKMNNKRYVDVIRRLIIEDVEPKRLACEMGITIENLYNIKKRAMAALTHTALDDIKKYNKTKSKQYADR